MNRVLFVVCLVWLAPILSMPVMDAHAAEPVTVYFFYGEGCPHCAREKPFLEEMKRKYPSLTVSSHEVWRNADNARFFSRLAEAYGIDASGVPTTFIGDFEPVVGFGKSGKHAQRIEQRIKECLVKGCPDPSGRLAAIGQPVLPPLSEEDRMMALPLFGQVDTGRLALPVLTLVLAGMDSFNPCAFFVLFTLLGILVHAGTRGKMLLIGGVFVFFSGFVYFLFMSAWLNFFLHVGEFHAVTVVAGVVALVIAFINIKDFFFFGKGVSLSIPDGAKPGLFERMRGLLRATSVVSVLTGTAVLAIVANTYELLCTAGFPMLFTRLLTLHGLDTGQYYLYLLLYNIIYVIPLTVIVAMFTITLGAKKLSERQGRVLKLVSGLMMLSLGAVILIDPMLLHNILTGAGLLLGSLVVAWAIVRLERSLVAGR